MKKAKLFLLGFLAINVGLLQRCDAADASCNYSQHLRPRTSYYVYSPNYPNLYRSRHSCQWIATSGYRVRLTCSIFAIPGSPNCAADHLGVEVDGSAPRRYCGNETFSVESRGRTMKITAESPIFSRGGRYLCELRAIEEQQESDDCRCGWKNPSRIVGGQEAGVNEYPMMAAMVDFVKRIAYCGATIIASKYVVTAAHCVSESSAEYTGVLVGEHNLSTGTDTNATQLLTVEAIIVHPSYSSSSEGFDIAVVRVKDQIAFSNEVGPACLPFQHYCDSYGGSAVLILGWGTTEFAGQRSDTLQVAVVDVITNLKCSRTFSNITRGEMCTFRKGKDSCQFDSGGPLLWMNPSTKRVTLVGIISYGILCGGDTPAVNVRVGAHMEWIMSVTPDADYCMAE